MDESYNKRALRSELLEFIKKAEIVEKSRALEDKQTELAGLQAYLKESLKPKSKVHQLLEPYFESARRRIQPTEEAPNHLECSISLTLLHDPVTVSSGMTYERTMLMDSIKASGGIDPNTRQQIGGDLIVGNKVMKLAVDDFLLSANYLDQNSTADYRSIKF